MVVPSSSPNSQNGESDGWTQMDETHMLRPVASFSQRDLNEGRIWFVADDFEETNNHGTLKVASIGLPYNFVSNENTDTKLHTDAIVFSVSDSSRPPNVLEGQKFHVEVEEDIEKKLDTSSTLFSEDALEMTVIHDNLCS